MSLLGSYDQYPVLVDTLPALVRKQRKHAAAIAAIGLIVVGKKTLAEHVADDKAVRGAIDALLLTAGLKKSDVVTCAGYDVRHNEREGATVINADTLTEKAVQGGVDRAFMTTIVVESTDTGDPAKFATVTPTKGAKVRP